MFTTIIIIHEFGHVIAALYYKWNIHKVVLLPFGALTIFNEKLNRPLKEEFIILISGPIFQIIGTYLFFKNNIEAINYSKTILFFNLLPIYPLDGSKFLNIILNKFLSFKKSHLITIYISIIFISFILIKVKFNLILTLTFLFISFKLIKEVKNHQNIFNKFLLERHLYNFNFKKTKIIKKVKDMKRDYKHIIKTNNIYQTEASFLAKKFDFNKKV